MARARTNARGRIAALKTGVCSVSLPPRYYIGILCFYNVSTLGAVKRQLADRGARRESGLYKRSCSANQQAAFIAKNAGPCTQSEPGAQ